MLRFSAFPKHTVDLFHDLLSPLDARIDELVRSRASLRRSEEIVCRLHVQARKNRCHDSNHALATFVHGWQYNSFAFCSPCGIEPATSACRAGHSTGETDEDVPARLVTKGSNRG